MTRLNIELADDVREKLAEQAAREGHASVEEYIQDLLSAEAEDYGGPSHLTYRDDAELKAVLLARVNDSRPGIEATPAFWEEFKRNVRERHGNGK